MAAPKRTPAELLRIELKAHSKDIPELQEFREMMRTVVPLMQRPDNIIDFVEARIELGLVTDPSVQRSVENIVRLCIKIEESMMGINKTEKPKPRVSNHEALCRRAEKERQHVPRVGYQPPVKLSLRTRMAQAYDRLVGIDFASRDG